MNVVDIMTHKPVTIRADQSLARALTLMQEVGCRHLPVISHDGHLIGVISDRDCRTVMNSPLVDQNPDDLLTRTAVRNAMSAAPIATEPHCSAAEAARLMLENHIGCLPVMRGETIVGIVTTSDIMMAFVRMQTGQLEM
ncbi:MAG: CBS domain-containing protein [Anaerolineae bacterium]|jgi:acetoin utilization protein AcuB|nr:CBS domain-containing protein [Anaerolineae bacterium]